MRAVTARLFTVYGPGEHCGRLLPSLIEAARAEKPLELTAGTQLRDLTYVEDVAEGLLRLGLAQAEPGSVVNLATGHLTMVRSLRRDGRAHSEYADGKSEIRRGPHSRGRDAA